MFKSKMLDKTEKMVAQLLTNITKLSWNCLQIVNEIDNKIAPKIVPESLMKLHSIFPLKLSPKLWKTLSKKINK